MDNLDKILYDKFEKYLILVILLTFKDGLINKRMKEEIRRRVKIDKELSFYYLLDYITLKKLEFSYYINMDIMKNSKEEIILDLSENIKNEDYNNRTIKYIQFSLLILLQKILEERIDFHLLPYAYGKRASEYIIKMTRNRNNINKNINIAKIIEFCFISFYNGLIDGISKYTDPKRIKYLKELYYVQNMKEYINNIKKLLTDLERDDFDKMLSNTLEIIKKENKFFKEIYEHGKNIGEIVGMYFKEHPSLREEVSLYIKLYSR